MTDKAEFQGGANVAMKLPERLYDETLAFYRDTLGLDVEYQDEDGARIAFGPIRLYLDRLPLQSQTDIWLELVTPDTKAARAHLDAKGTTVCNEVEALPEGFDGFWIASPSGTIHLVAGDGPKEED